MWLNTFSAMTHSGTLPSAILADRVPLMRGSTRLRSGVVERVSGILASSLPLSGRSAHPRRLIFLVPSATSALSQHVAVCLLLADFVHRQGPQNGFGVHGESAEPVINGDLLLVTQRIRDCTALLRDLSFKRLHERLPVTNYWHIDVLSKYTPPECETPRIFVANPGWLSSVPYPRRTFGCAIIDASHPRTRTHLDAVLAHPLVSQAGVQVIVVPPCEEDRLRQLRMQGQATTEVWGWDPIAESEISRIATPSEPITVPKISDRFLWLCQDEPVDELLRQLHTSLTKVARISHGQYLPVGLSEAWAVYHCLRQLAVPLLPLEEEHRKGPRAITLQERIRALGEQEPLAHGPLATFLDAAWPAITRDLKQVYGILMERAEPGKLYALAAVVDRHIKQTRASKSAEPIWIVSSSEQEARFLVRLLADLVDDWTDVLQGGSVNVITVRDEARLIADGKTAISILLGFRASHTRYLDVYPRSSIDVIAYPYEAEVDAAIQDRLYQPMERFQDDAVRVATLHALRLDPAALPHARQGVCSASVTTNMLTAARPIVRHALWTGAPVHIVRSAEQTVRDMIEPLTPADLTDLASTSAPEEYVRVQELGLQPGILEGREVKPMIEIVDEEGERQRCFADRIFDVYFPATEKLERLAAGQLQPGMLLVVFVDDHYDDVFRRMLEAIDELRDARASISLAFWDHAKQVALSLLGGSRRHLHEELARRGVSVDYSATVSWYAPGEDGIIAPLRASDFALLAQLSGLYVNVEQIDQTFRHIRDERLMRRKCGRELRSFLKHLAGGVNYEAALISAKALDTPVEQVAAAIALREVVSVRRLEPARGRDRWQDVWDYSVADAVTCEPSSERADVVMHRRGIR